MGYKSGSFVLIKSFLLVFYVLELGAVQEKEILKTIREFLNNLPDEENYFTDGIILSLEKMDNNIQKLEVNLHASKIDPTTTKLVKCIASILYNESNIEIKPEHGYNCEDITVPKYEYYANRLKRSNPLGGEIDQDPKNPEYKEMAQRALVKYSRSRDSKIHSDLHDLVVSVVKVTKQVVSGVLVRIYFEVDNQFNTGEEYACTAEILLQSGWSELIRKVDCRQSYTNMPGPM